MTLIVLPKPQKPGPDVYASEMLGHLSDTTPDDAKVFVLRVVDGNLLFHTSNVTLAELNMYLDQAKKHLLEGGFI